jgi:hypothetical protein
MVSVNREPCALARKPVGLMLIRANPRLLCGWVSMTSKVRQRNVRRNAAIFREVLDGATLAATGRKFGVTGPAVRQLIGRMVHAIREELLGEDQPAPHSRGVRELREHREEWLELLDRWVEIYDPQ